MTQAKIETTLAERGQQAKPPEQTSGAGGKPMEQHAEPGADERAAFELPELPEPLEIDWPTLDAHALGCGVEDRGLRDRYDCANYGFETGVDKAASCVPNEIYDADQMREYAQAAVSAWQIRAAQSGQRAGVPVEAVAKAYGYLWHVNEMNADLAPIYPPAKAAYAARKVLREFLTHEQRGEAINEAGREIGCYVDESDHAAAPTQQVPK